MISQYFDVVDGTAMSYVTTFGSSINDVTLTLEGGGVQTEPLPFQRERDVQSLVTTCDV